MSVVVTILAGIGLIFVIFYLIYYLYVYLKYKSDQKKIANINPPSDYMQNTGIKCPDYWVNTGVDSNGNYKCHNSFNITTYQPTTGNFIDKCNKTDLTFKKIKDGFTWEYNDPNGLKSYTEKERYDFLKDDTDTNDNILSRCGWINNCGPSSSTQGIWSGVNEICNAPPPS